MQRGKTKTSVADLGVSASVDQRFHLGRSFEHGENGNSGSEAAQHNKNKYPIKGLGKGGASKLDEFLEKFQGG